MIVIVVTVISTIGITGPFLYTEFTDEIHALPKHLRNDLSHRYPDNIV